MAPPRRGREGREGKEGDERVRSAVSPLPSSAGWERGSKSWEDWRAAGSALLLALCVVATAEPLYSRASVSPPVGITMFIKYFRLFV